MVTSKPDHFVDAPAHTGWYGASTTEIGDSVSLSGKRVGSESSGTPRPHHDRVARTALIIYLAPTLVFFIWLLDQLLRRRTVMPLEWSIWFIVVFMTWFIAAYNLLMNGIRPKERLVDNDYARRLVVMAGMLWLGAGVLIGAFVWAATHLAPSV